MVHIGGNHETIMVEESEIELVDLKEDYLVESMYNPVTTYSKYINIGQAIPTLTWEEI